MKNPLPTQDQIKAALYYDPDTGIFIRLGGFHAKRWGMKIAGHRKRDGYVLVKLGKVGYKAHRLAWVYMTGKWPDGDVDHINGDPSDNRFANLRVATRQLNTINKKRHHTNKSGLKGVHKLKKGRDNDWVANLQRPGAPKHLGVFPTAEAAHEAYLAAAREHYGEFVCQGDRPIGPRNAPVSYKDEIPSDVLSRIKDSIDSCSKRNKRE